MIYKIDFLDYLSQLDDDDLINEHRSADGTLTQWYRQQIIAALNMLTNAAMEDKRQRKELRDILKEKTPNIQVVFPMSDKDLERELYEEEGTFRHEFNKEWSAELDKINAMIVDEFARRGM